MENGNCLGLRLGTGQVRDLTAALPGAVSSPPPPPCKLWLGH